MKAKYEKFFKIDEHATILCEWKKTRNGFKHEAALLVDGMLRDKVKICYLNRTWEAFEYQSVISKLLDKTGYLNDAERKQFMDGLGHKAHEEVQATFGNIAMIAKLGEIFHEGDKKGINDWKARMLKAGLEPLGLMMPDDWGGLDEEVKEERLNALIGELQKRG